MNDDYWLKVVAIVVFAVVMIIFVFGVLDVLENARVKIKQVEAQLIMDLIEEHECDRNKCLAETYVRVKGGGGSGD